MRVLIVNMTLDPVTGGGSAARALQSARALADRGIECTVAAAADGLERVADQLDGIEVVTLGTTGGRFRVPIAGFAQLDRAVARADVMLLVNHWTSVNVAAYRAARQFGRPYVVSPVGALPLFGRSRALKVIYNACYGRRIMRDAAAHIAVTGDEVRQFAPYGVAIERVRVIPNGMPAMRPGDADQFRSAHGLAGAPFVLFLGRLAPIKGPDLLIDAFARAAPAFPAWRLVMAGPDDGMRVDLERRVRDRGLAGRVHFTGFLDSASKADALAACACLAVPSRRDAMSIVVLEAAAAGRAALVTDQCGIAEVERSGGGWVVGATVADLERGLRQAMSEPDELAAKGLVWQRYAADRFAWTRVADQYLDLFSRVLQSTRREERR